MKVKADTPILNCGNCRFSTLQEGQLTCWAEPPKIEGEDIVRGVPTEPDEPACVHWAARMNA